MKIGFTGSRQGLTTAQRDTLTKVLHELAPSEAHHGDCLGADAEFDELCRPLGIAIHIHPPDDPRQRAWRNSIAPCTVHSVRPFLTRNKAIVVACDLLLAAPAGFKEVRQSGTWATIRHARNVGRPLIIVFPDGTIGREPA